MRLTRLQEIHDARRPDTRAARPPTTARGWATLAVALLLGLAGSVQPGPAGAISPTPVGTVMVKDITTGTGGAPPSYLTSVGGTLFFRADDGTHGIELWKTDGTAAGTVLVKDILPGAGSSGLLQLRNVNGILLFRANDGSHGTELWRSDGTEAGTVLVKDIRPGAGGSDPSMLTTVDGALFFSADDGIHGPELWKTDGTEAGTVLVKDIVTGPVGSYLENLKGVGDTLFFTPDDGAHGYELWKSDGSEAGTVLVKDIVTGSGSSDPSLLTNVNDTLFFTASDGVHGSELWKSDGTEAGTVLVKDIVMGSGGASYSRLTSVGGVLFFSAHDGVHGSELWTSDGTGPGTVLVKDIDRGTSGSVLDELTNVGGTLFFTADDAVHGFELWKSDGTEAGTVLVKDINPGGDANPNALRGVAGSLFFVATEGIHGVELWRSDGTAAGTVLVKDIQPGAASSMYDLGTSIDSTLFFVADDGTHGYELWRTDGTAAGPPAAPTPLAPSGTIASRRPAYRWSPVGEAATYSVRVIGPGGAPVLQAEHAGGSICDATACQVTPPNVLLPGAHIWQIQARNFAGDGPWSSMTAFQVAAPTIVVSPTAGLRTTEAGGAAVFTVSFSAPPIADVTIGLSSSDASEGTVNPTSLTFTPVNGTTPRTVTVTGVDDAQVDGDVAYTVVLARAVSTDPAFNQLDATDVAVTNQDNDVTPPPGPSAVSLTVTRTGTGAGTVAGPGIACGGDCQERYPSGTQATLTAAPALGNDRSTFAGWGGACSQAGTTPTCTLTLTKDTVVTAVFQRVNVGIQVGRPPGVSPSGDPALVVSLTARAGCGPIASIRFGQPGQPFDNARVTITDPAGGPADQLAGFGYTPPPATTSVSLTIRRVVPSGGATVNPVLFTDGCGEWPTFVGGGPDSFR